MDRVCADIRQLINEHVQAMKIQYIIRKWFFNHVYKKGWCELRNLIMCKTTSTNFALLQHNSNIRREWRSEADSWIYMLKHEDDTLSLIVNEVKYGVWTAA